MKIILFFLALTLTSYYVKAQHNPITSEINQQDQSITSSIQNLNAIAKAGKVFINWTQIPSEYDFELSIERSENGKDFIEINNKKGFNSDISLFYSFIDNNPIQYVSYYKIKLINSLGEIRYSQIKQVYNSDAESLPNSNRTTASLN